MLRCLAAFALMFVVGLMPQPSIANNVIRLTAQEWPPYQMVAGDGVDGVAARVVRCALVRLGFEPKITILPWPQAQQEVREGRADGFFDASENLERDAYATLSIPIVPEVRRWYWRHDRVVNVDDRTIAVAVQSGTVMHQWLIENGYKNIHVVSTIEDLIYLLNSENIDAIFSNQLVFDWNVAISGISMDAFNSLESQEVGLGVYFRNSYLSEHPGFLQKFNEQAEDCRMSVHLSPE